MERFTSSKLFRVLIYVLLSIIIVYMLLQIKPLFMNIYIFLRAVLAPFLIALIVSYVLNPVVTLLNARKVPRTVAVLLIYAVFITSAVVVLMNLIPIFISQVKELNEHLPEFTFRAQSLVSDFNDNTMLPGSVRSGINNSLYKMETMVSTQMTTFLDGIGNIINTIFIAFVIPFLAFYILKDFQLIEKTVIATVPKRHRRSTVKLLIDIDTALGNYIRGQFIVCIIIGMFAYIGYWAVGMPYALLLASVVAVFNIIPYLGPFFGAAPAILMASTVSLKMVMLVILVNLLCQVLEGNVVSPQVVGRTLHMHPLFIIFALLVGGELAGVIGLILAVPFFAALKVVVQHIFAYYIRRNTA
ncbi:permease [Paenibacillus swuensis]|uniref:Permease n=1 Tax=Paenibacillus swuensis TaxID=1178515 RepID=A0A172TJI2_9BACL|nr:AI-2E family transporter [Paenibacillus swuensis]ANE47211.1 permease [Paenibacillus swuensis]